MGAVVGDRQMRPVARLEAVFFSEEDAFFGFHEVAGDVFVVLVERVGVAGSRAFPFLHQDRPVFRFFVGVHPRLYREFFGLIERRRGRDRDEVFFFGVEIERSAVAPVGRPFGAVEGRGVAVAGQIGAAASFVRVERVVGERARFRGPQRRRHIDVDFGAGQGTVVDARLVEAAFEAPTPGSAADRQRAGGRPGGFRRGGGGGEFAVDVEAQVGAVVDQRDVAPGAFGQGGAAVDPLRGAMAAGFADPRLRRLFAAGKQLVGIFFFAFRRARILQRDQRLRFRRRDDRLHPGLDRSNSSVSSRAAVTGTLTQPFLPSNLSPSP